MTALAILAVVFDLSRLSCSFVFFIDRNMTFPGQHEKTMVVASDANRGLANVQGQPPAFGAARSAYNMTQSLKPEVPRLMQPAGGIGMGMGMGPSQPMGGRGFGGVQPMQMQNPALNPNSTPGRPNLNQMMGGAGLGVGLGPGGFGGGIGGQGMHMQNQMGPQGYAGGLQGGGNCGQNNFGQNATMGLGKPNLNPNTGNHFGPVSSSRMAEVTRSVPGDGHGANVQGAVQTDGISTMPPGQALGGQGSLLMGPATSSDAKSTFWRVVGIANALVSLGTHKRVTSGLCWFIAVLWTNYSQLDQVSNTSDTNHIFMAQASAVVMVWFSCISVLLILRYGALRLLGQVLVVDKFLAAAYLSGVGVLVMDEPRRGWYIHGKSTTSSANGSSVSNSQFGSVPGLGATQMEESADLYNKAEAIKLEALNGDKDSVSPLGARGLYGSESKGGRTTSSQSLQTYELYLNSTNFDDSLSALIRELQVSKQAASGSENTPSAENSLSPSIGHAVQLVRWQIQSDFLRILALIMKGGPSAVRAKSLLSRLFGQSWYTSPGRVGNMAGVLFEDRSKVGWLSPFAFGFDCFGLPCGNEGRKLLLEMMVFIVSLRYSGLGEAICAAIAYIIGRIVIFAYKRVTRLTVAREGLVHEQLIYST